jgi:hypothetical protein
MRNVVTRFAPWQSAKALALTYFFMGFVIAVPMALMSMFVPAEPGQAKPGRSSSSFCHSCTVLQA